MANRKPLPPQDPIALAAQAVRLAMGGRTADQALSEIQSDRGRLPSQERLAVGDAVFQALRHWRLAQYLVEPEPLTPEWAIALQVLLADWPDTPHQDFRSRWASELNRRLTDRDRSFCQVAGERMAGLRSASPAIRSSLPDWLVQAIEQDHPELHQEAAFWSAWLTRAPVDLRVNLALCKRAQALEALAQAGVTASLTPYSPWGLRLAQPVNLTQLPLYRRGQIEFQDEASQMLAALVGAKRGHVVVDFCAGAGGKTLALGAMMRATGEIFAMDVSAARLEAMKPRLARAGLKQVNLLALQSHHDPRLSRLRGRADAVLVDAPCSGLGTLRRAPELKWQVTPETVKDHAERQLDILRSAAQLVKPGGRLVYATCSFLKAENEQVALAFDALRLGFEPVAAENLLDSLQCPPDAGLCDPTGRWFRTWPHRHQTDAFFASIWVAR